MSGALTPKQQRFVAEYLKDLNATQAAIRAGYSRKTAQQQGSRLLSNVVVAAEIAAKQSKIAEKLDVTAERVIGELAKLGFSNMQDYVSTHEGEPFVDLSDLERAQWAAVGELTVDRYTDGRRDDAREVKRVKFKLSDKRAALVDLGKYLGLFIERAENNNTVTLVDAVDRPERETREQWVIRRSKELGIDPRLMGATAGAAD